MVPAGGSTVADRDVGQLEGKRVGNSVVASGVYQPNRIVRRHSIEICGSHVAAFGKFTFVPTRAGHPFAGFQLGHFIFYAGHNFSHRRCVGEPNAKKFIDSSVGNMSVRIDESGCRGAPVKIDDASARILACKFQDFRVGTDLHDDAATNGDGLRHRVLGVNCEDVAVNQNEVGRILR